ncbi:MAG TPA: pyridoxal-phosphate dependent enzyme [Puia sp.]|nr:pyridoxal-phosphate dependent enzyme [Puia sp.]
MVNLNAAIIEKLPLPKLAKKSILVDVLRLDKIHNVISGNKWFKLKYYLQEALNNRYENILTFGGAYSNHIIATACAAKMLGLKSIGVIRGEESAALSHTLKEARSFDMQLEFVSREEYKNKAEPSFLNNLHEKFPGCYIIPEGGEGALGVKGSAEILTILQTNDYSHIFCAIGTGTMFAGIVNSSLQTQNVIGVCVLKGMKNIPNEISSFIAPDKKNNFEVNHDYHFGGYAKKNNELIKFMKVLYEQTDIPSDFVYTGKLFYAVNDLIEKKYFPDGSKLLIIHSGGLQGNLSLPEGTLIF